MSDEVTHLPRPLIIPVGTTLPEAEEQMIKWALEQTNQNRTKAAEKLGICVRTLRNKLKAYRMKAAA